jgi:tripartite-type tricarboxylate transporter receptor subunit TctC
MKRFVVIGLLGGAVGVFGAAILPSVAPLALAQSYPSRPVNVIVPFPPGGNTDIMARALQNEMSKALSQTMVIINKPGAAGTLGLIELSRAAPDGYTLALTPNNPLTAQPHVQKLPYAMQSFRFVCLTYFAPYVLIAGPQAPFKSFGESSPSPRRSRRFSSTAMRDSPANRTSACLRCSGRSAPTGLACRSPAPDRWRRHCSAGP